MKKITAIALSVLIMLSLLTACEISIGGEVITVSEITGSSAKLIKSDKSEQDAATGAEITAGCRLTTGNETCVYLKIDEDSVIKMNEKSEISVSKVSSSSLKIELIKGSVLVNEKGKEGRLEMTAGNTLLTVRGTFFTANYDGDNIVVDLIEGKIDVKSDSGEVTKVDQGNRVMVDKNEDAVVNTLDISLFDSFTIDSVMEYKDVLTEGNGSLSELDFSYISDSWSGGYKSDSWSDDSGVRSDGDDGYVSDAGDVIYDGVISEDAVQGDVNYDAGDVISDDSGVKSESDGGDVVYYG